MKAKVLLISALTLLTYTSLFAQSEIYINYLTVPHNMAQPVTVKTNLGTFTFSGSYTISGRIEQIEAFTINGDRIMVDKPRIKEGTNASGFPCMEYYYSFTKYIPGSSSYITEGQDGEKHNPYYFSSGVGEIKGFWAKDYSDWRRKLFISTGYGSQYGGGFGANITGKGASGGIGFSAGVGYDKRSKYTKIPTGYLALLFGYKNWDIETGLIHRYFPYEKYSGLGLSMLTNWNIKIYGPIGINTGVGVTLYGDGEAPEVNPEFTIGLTMRLHQVR